MRKEDLKEEAIRRDNSEKILYLIIGVICGGAVMLMFYPERIAKLKNGEEVAVKVGKENITADDFYEGFKDTYSVNELIEKVDNIILYDKYTLTTEDINNINTSADNYIAQYEQYYGMNEEEFLTQAGYDTKEDFVKYLELDYLRNKYYKDYIKDNISNEELENYYNSNVYGLIHTEHILVQTQTENAKDVATEILDKLTSGASWEDLKTEYKDKTTQEQVDVEFDSNLEEAYKTAAENLKDGEYSKALVTTSYGYHIIYRVSSEEKEDLKTLKDRIKSAILKVKESQDSKLFEKTMIQMRKDEGMEIKDTLIKKAYDKYLKAYES